MDKFLSWDNPLWSAITGSAIAGYSVYFMYLIAAFAYPRGDVFACLVGVIFISLTLWAAYMFLRHSLYLLKSK